MFLNRMPHLCEKMRRLTSKDAASRKKNEDGLAPNFYELSQSNPLPDDDRERERERERERKPAANEPTIPTRNGSADLLGMEKFIADQRRAIGLASLFMDQNAGGIGGRVGAFSMHQVANRQGGGWHSGLSSLQSLQNANTAALLYGHLMPPPSLSAMSEHMRRLQILKSGANSQELAKLMSMNMAFPEGVNFNFWKETVRDPKALQ